MAVAAGLGSADRMLVSHSHVLAKSFASQVLTREAKEVNNVLEFNVFRSCPLWGCSD